MAKAKTPKPDTPQAEPLTSLAAFRRRVRAHKKVADIMKAHGGGADYWPNLKPLLTAGEFFGGANVALAKDDPVIHAHFKRHRPKLKQCYANSQDFVIANDDEHATYYEGYTSKGPDWTNVVHHAWLVVNGTVYDITLEMAARKLKTLGFGDGKVGERTYFGLPFGVVKVAEHMLGDHPFSLVGMVPSAI